MISPKRVKALLKRIPETRILVIGDLILDHYIWGNVSRISPEAPVPVVQVERESRMLGGAANVGNNLSVLGVQTDLLGVIGDDDNGRHFRKLLKENGISPKALLTDPSRQTTRKTRVIAHNQQVVRVDREDAPEYSPLIQKKILQQIRKRIPQVDAVILEDYGKGILNQENVDATIQLCREQGVYCAVDPKVEQQLHFRGASLATPNNFEAEYLAKWSQASIQTLPGQGDKLRKALGLEHLLITLGDKGMALFIKDGKPQVLPTLSQEVYDVSGAGDTVISVFTASIAAGATPYEAANMANIAGGIVVGKLGTATVTSKELIAHA
jgi:rfaE bifunctional protein kinase chain/domain